MSVRVYLIISNLLASVSVCLHVRHEKFSKSEIYAAAWAFDNPTRADT
jgi:hypothetical protein